MFMGLNRAIFIAAAKKGFKSGSASKGKSGRGKVATSESAAYNLGDDMAYKEEMRGVMLFTIGGQVQTREGIRETGQVEVRKQLFRSMERSTDICEEFRQRDTPFNRVFLQRCVQAQTRRSCRKVDV
jgi:hypothetical protein